MSTDGFVIEDGVLTIDGDPYPAADLMVIGGEPWAEFDVHGFSFYLTWEGMFEGATTPHVMVAITDARHDNWFEHIAFSDWEEEVVYRWATPSDVRSLLARLSGGWIPKAGEHSGVGLRLPGVSW